MEKKLPRINDNMVNIRLPKWDRETLRKAKEKTGISISQLLSRYCMILEDRMDSLTPQFAILIFADGVLPKALLMDVE